MSKPTLRGFPQSSYVWTARAAFHVKGVDHEFVPMKPGEHKTPEHLAIHPFGKVPVLTDPALCETSAIVRWVDSHEGPSLFGDDALQAAHIEQFVSIQNCYLYKRVVIDWLFAHIFAEGEPDPAALEKAHGPIAEALAAVAAKKDGTFLVGERVSAADLFIGPMLFGLSRYDDGKKLLGAQPELLALVGKLAATPAFMAGAPAP